MKAKKKLLVIGEPIPEEKINKLLFLFNFTRLNDAFSPSSVALG
jgi:hypothetical protein